MKYLILFITWISLFTSCKKADIKKDEKPEKSVVEIPKWNTSKTAKVYFLSKLSNEGIDKSISNYDSIIKFLRDKTSQLIILDRSDVEFGTSFNGSVYLASALKKFHVYALNQIQGNQIQGTGLLINHTITKQNQYKISDNCFLKAIDTRVKKGIDFPVATVRFENNLQIENASSLLSFITKQSKVLIGTVRIKDKSILSSEIKKIDTRYHLDFVSNQNDGEYVLFISAPKFWVLRKSDKITINNQLKMFELDIEANVFY